MLFSERCDGTLYQRPQFGYWDILRTTEWTNLAKQMLFAFDYMRLRAYNPHFPGVQAETLCWVWGSLFQ
jgi:hypothetical protein